MRDSNSAKAYTAVRWDDTIDVDQLLNPDSDRHSRSGEWKEEIILSGNVGTTSPLLSVTVADEGNEWCNEKALH